jgi:hypothetical protein
VEGKLAGYGLQLDSVGVKDIVLPGEMKTILAQVVEAGKSAEANVIRRREETAATRSLLNTAKVMEDNPVALRMKELETLERVAERIDKISVGGSVLNGLDQVLNGKSRSPVKCWPSWPINWAVRWSPTGTTRAARSAIRTCWPCTTCWAASAARTPSTCS